MSTLSSNTPKLKAFQDASFLFVETSNRHLARAFFPPKLLCKNFQYFFFFYFFCKFLQFSLSNFMCLLTTSHWSYSSILTFIFPRELSNDLIQNPILIRLKKSSRQNSNAIRTVQQPKHIWRCDSPARWRERIRFRILLDSVENCRKLNPRKTSDEAEEKCENFTFVNNNEGPCFGNKLITINYAKS